MAFRSLKRSSTVPSEEAAKSAGLPHLKRVGGSKRSFGNRKRAVARSPATLAPVKSAQPTPTRSRNERRVVAGLLGGAFVLVSAMGATPFTCPFRVRAPGFFRRAPFQGA